MSDLEDKTMRDTGEHIRAFAGTDDAEATTARAPAEKIGAGARPAAGRPGGRGIIHAMPAGRDFVSARAEATVGKVLDLESGSFTITKVISQDLSGEADIYLVRKGTEDFVYKLYRATTPPKADVLARIQELQHPHVIRLVEHGQLAGQFYEIMEYAAGGTIDRHAPIRDLGRLRAILDQLVEAFNYCHERGLIHQDIKPENIFCRDEAGTDVMIADFGIASVLSEGAERTESKSNLTLGYAAPEAYGSTAGGMEFDPIIGRETDYYALGITLIHLWEGHFPFKGLTKRVVIDITRSGNLEVPEDMPNELKHVIAGLTTVNYLDRWGYEETKKWLAGEHVPVAQGQSFEVKTLEPYPFVQKNGETLYARSLPEMAALMYEHPKEAIKRLYRGDIADWVRPVDPLLYHALRDIVEEEFVDQESGGQRKAIYVLDPDHPFITTRDEKLPKGATIEETLENIGDYLDSGPDRRQAASIFCYEMKAYLDTVNEEALAKQFINDCETLSEEKAVNRLIIALQGEEQLKIEGERFGSYEELRMASDEVKKALVAQLHDTDSKFLVWLELMGLKLDSTSIDETHPAELVGMLREMPWIKLFDEKLRDRLNAVDAEGWSDLMKMTVEHDVETCRELIASGADVNQRSAEGSTALALAARENHADLVTILLDAGANPEIRDAEEKTVLHQAVDVGAEESVAALLAAGAEVNAVCTHDGWSPLRSAVNLGYEGIARRLLDSGADPNLRAEGHDEMVPLHNAAADNSEALVSLLLRHGADPSGGAPDNFTPLHLAARDNATEAIRRLAEAGADLNREDAWNIAPLHYAVMEKSAESLRVLLEVGADPDVGTYDCPADEESEHPPRPTPLLFAAINGDRDLAGILLQHGADTGAQFDGQTAAFSALWNEDVVLLRMLLDAGADPSQACSDGFSLVHLTIQTYQLEALELLLSRGANVNALYTFDEDEPPLDPLVFAVEKKFTDGIRLLAQKGAGKGKNRHDGLDPLRMAMYSGELKSLRTLLEAGYKPEWQLDESHQTIWHSVAHENMVDACRILCETRASGMNMPNNYGYTPLMLAAYYGHREIVDLLLKHGARLGPRAKNSNSTALDLALEGGHPGIADRLAQKSRIKAQNALATVLSWPFKIALALTVLYTLFYFAGRRFLMAGPWLIPDTVPELAGYLIWAFVFGHVATWLMYAGRIRTVRNYVDWRWLKDPGGIGAFVKVLLKPGLLGVLVYLLAAFFQARTIPLIGSVIADTGAARILDQHLLSRFLPSVHAYFIDGGAVAELVPPVATYPVVAESIVAVLVLTTVAFFIGRWKDTAQSSVRRLAGR